MTYSRNNGGRVLLLFLLFLLALYQLSAAGFTSFAIVCLIPLVILYIYSAFRWKMLTFWMLIIINYFLQMKDIAASLPVPMSLPNELLEITLLAIAIVDARENPHFERCGNLMLFALVIWCGFCTLEVLNDTCNLGIDIAAWYTGARLMAFQMLYIFLVFCIYISSPKVLLRYVRIWAALALFSVFWVWKQQYIGFTQEEKYWMENIGHNTHILNAGTLIRYFSTFSDAANYGCNAAATAVAFLIMGITTKRSYSFLNYKYFGRMGNVRIWYESSFGGIVGRPNGIHCFIKIHQNSYSVYDSIRSFCFHSSFYEHRTKQPANPPYAYCI